MRLHGVHDGRFLLSAAGLAILKVMGTLFSGFVERCMGFLPKLVVHSDHRVAHLSLQLLALSEELGDLKRQQIKSVPTLPLADHPDTDGKSCS